MHSHTWVVKRSTTVAKRLLLSQKNNRKQMSRKRRKKRKRKNQSRIRNQLTKKKTEIKKNHACLQMFILNFDK